MQTLSLQAKKNSLISNKELNKTNLEIKKTIVFYDWVKIESSCGTIYYLDRNNYINDIHMAFAIEYFDKQKCPNGGPVNPTTGPTNLSNSTN